ncbi:Holliday junction resolvase RuvX [Mycoplasma struthionis]|uniref:Putative pre-16S rRNA nuclease n=1 Tax=Mycoplasma struthionis TaxID=538220 RepID=A0A3G8LI32_9MOLU|nr:Holliday junction resolvase RuvX [Mycoplasma struthionis]AZG68885.1 Holliday junction resolvase RuvX [Mycoplasma struthionis]
MRAICLDLGTRSCGFAISDKSRIIVSPLENFGFELNHFKHVIAKLKYYLYESEYKNEIDLIVLGYPLRMDLSKSERTFIVERFKNRLSNEIEIPIVFQDERQSTINAEDILISAGFSRQKRKTKKDSLAAQLILEEYLRRQNG